MTKVLGVIRCKLLAASLVTVGDVARAKPEWRELLGVSSREASPLHDVSYVDDCAYPIFGCASELCGKVARTASTVHETLGAFGLDVNVRKGKTEVIAMMAGRGAVSVKHDLFVRDKGAAKLCAL